MISQDYIIQTNGDVFSDCVRDMPDDITWQEFQAIVEKRYKDRMDVILNPVEKDLPMDLPE